MLSQAVGLAALGGKKGGIVSYLSKVGRPGADIGMSRRTRRSRRSSVRKSSNHHLCEHLPVAPCFSRFGLCSGMAYLRGMMVVYLYQGSSVVILPSQEGAHLCDRGHANHCTIALTMYTVALWKLRMHISPSRLISMAYFELIPSRCSTFVDAIPISRYCHNLGITT
jgi:hypothetical protein